jgi:hypothetical protein
MNQYGVFGTSKIGDVKPQAQPPRSDAFEDRPQPPHGTVTRHRWDTVKGNENCTCAPCQEVWDAYQAYRTERSRHKEMERSGSSHTDLCRCDACKKQKVEAMRSGRREKTAAAERAERTARKWAYMSVPPELDKKLAQMEPWLIAVLKSKGQIPADWIFPKDRSHDQD